MTHVGSGFRLLLRKYKSVAENLPGLRMLTGVSVRSAVLNVTTLVSAPGCKGRTGPAAKFRLDQTCSGRKEKNACAGGAAFSYLRNMATHDPIYEKVISASPTRCGISVTRESFRGMILRTLYLRATDSCGKLTPLSSLDVMARILRLCSVETRIGTDCKWRVLKIAHI
jgi:hypothetical protein